MIPFINEFFLLNPLALFGLISLIIPILIHLFNPSRGKLILVGNIELIKKIKNVRVTEVKINQWLLLLTRLVIFLLLVLLLTQLIKQDKKEYSKQTHIMVTPDWLNNATESDLAELRKNHSSDSVFMLAPSFKKITLDSIEASVERTATLESSMSIDALLLELQEKGLATQNTIIYATNYLAQFLPEKIQTLQRPHFKWRIKQLGPNKRLLTSLNIAVYYSPSRELDHRYLKLALNTISKISEIELVVNHYPIKAIDKQTKSSFSNETQTDWIFWLSEEAAPKILLEKVKQGSYLFSDKLGDQNQTNRHRKNSITLPIKQTWIRFYSKPFNQPEPHLRSIWYNYKGQTALSQETIHQGKFFRFGSRFHPDWNNLISDVQFPLILADILSEHPKLNQQKQLSASEIAPVLTQGPIESDAKTGLRTSNNPQRPYLLLLVCLLWLFERWLSEKRGITSD